MESVFWGEGCGSPDDWGPKDGPQVRGDLEDGCWGGNRTAAANWGTNQPINASFVTAMLKGDSGNHWTLKGGDAQKADGEQTACKVSSRCAASTCSQCRRCVAGLLTLYDGPRPTSAYHPMKKAGAIILGTGGGKLDACWFRPRKTF